MHLRITSFVIHPSSVVLLLLLATSHAYGEGTFPNGMCWPAKEVVIRFNSNLGLDLENPMKRVPPVPSIGVAKDREEAMTLAVNAWNKELIAVGANLRLKLEMSKKKDDWAGVQGKVECTDPDTNQPVFTVDYLRTTGDKVNSASTAQDNFTKVQGPGWVQGGGMMTETIDKRLAETSLLPAPNAPATNGIQEADIMWFTHTSEGRRCPQIRWNYRHGDKNNPGPAARPYFDFYSVMLHEIGHLLGLDHQSCGKRNGNGWTNNVMEATLAPGERNEILNCERRILQTLYGRGGTCFRADL